MVEASMSIAERRPAFAGKSASGPAASVAVLPVASRLSLRAPAASLSALSKALGLDLPTRPKSSVSDGTRCALCLGPDEWLILDEAGVDLTAPLASVGDFHAAVDVSHRNVGFIVSGAGAASAINAGCPQDLSLAAFPVDAASRTILHKIEIVLYRTGETEFRVECWRSFADYAFSYLAEAVRDPLS